MKIPRVLPLVLCLLGMSSFAFAQAPLTPEIRVNAGASSPDPFFLSVAMNTRGEFVVVWPVSATGSILARRFAADGTPLTGEIVVSSQGVGRAAVALSEDGSFLVAHYVDFTIAGRRLESRVFAPDGTALGEALPLAESFSADIVAVARNDGGFVVAWSDRKTVYRLLGPGGEPLGPERSLGEGFHPSIAVGPEDEMVVVWRTFDRGTGRRGYVGAQRLGPDGSRRGPKIRVGGIPWREAYKASVAIDGDGNFFIVWSEKLAEGVLGRRYNKKGKALTRVRRLAAPGVPVPAIAMDRQGGGGMVLVVEDPRGPSSWDVLAQRLDEQGSPQGPLVFVGNSSDLYPYGERVASDGAGSFVVVWQSGTSILARVFRRE